MGRKATNIGRRIDISRETRLKFADVPRFLAGTGRTVALRTVYGWREAGILEWGRMGGVLETSVEALQRMFDRGQPVRERAYVDPRKAEEACRILESKGA